MTVIIADMPPMDRATYLRGLFDDLLRTYDELEARHQRTLNENDRLEVELDRLAVEVTALRERKDRLRLQLHAATEALHELAAVAGLAGQTDLVIRLQALAQGAAAERLPVDPKREAEMRAARMVADY
jgi:predicted nuclease with TOPRIM domain